MTTVNYHCAKCGKELSKDERPCPDCGSSERKIDVTIEDVIQIKDRINIEVNQYTDLFDSLSKGMNIVYYVFVLIFPMSIILLTFYYRTLQDERIIYASMGILTFIAIFYSLIFSKEGHSIIHSTTEIIDKKMKSLKDLVLTNADNLRNNREYSNIIKEINTISDQFSKIGFVRKISDIEWLLVMSVGLLFFSILFSLFDDSILNVFATISFILGFCLSFVIVIDWRVISINYREYRKREADKNILK